MSSSGLGGAAGHARSGTLAWGLLMVSSAAMISGLPSN